MPVWCQQVKPWARACALTAAVLLTGCGSSHWATPATDDPALAAAISRWDACVARSASLDDAYCEGYRRDIAHHYPVHLEGRVRTQLQANEKQRWLKRISTNYGDTLESETLQRAVVD